MVFMDSTALKCISCYVETLYEEQALGCKALQVTLRVNSTTGAGSILG